MAIDTGIKNTYIKISFADGLYCICEPGDVADMTEGNEGHTTEEVKLTQAEFDALPEFEA